MGRSRFNEDRHTVIGIDLGQSCGYCAIRFDGGDATRMESGTWDFKGHHGGGGIQGLRLERFLNALIVSHLAKATSGVVLAYEVVEFGHKGSGAARVYYGMMSTLQMVCERLNVPFDGVPPSTLKKAVTGHGNSSKEQVASVIDRVLAFEPRKCPVCRAVGMMSPTGRCTQIIEKGKRKGKPCPGWLRREDESDACAVALALARQLGWWRM